MKSLLKQWWFWIVSISFLTYYPVINNFFGWDDFLWLYRAKTLSLNPSQIFYVDTFYFDPLVHLSFWLNFKLSALDYRWYHLTDILIHTINGLLLFHFVKLYSKDKMLSLLGSLIFVSTFAASDAVLWSSSRVDILATLFSLVALISFLNYLRKGKTSLYVASLVTYILALAAKGTPVVLPVLLLWIFLKERKEVKKGYNIFAPFVIIAVGYFILLRLATDDGNSVFKGAFYLNLHNYSLAVASLFIPETVLSKLNLTYAFFSIYSLLFVFWFIKFSPETNRIKLIGLFMMLLFLTPVLILGKFTLASGDKPTHYLLGSPSHRIYMASMGMSVFVSAVIINLYGVLSPKKDFLAKTLLVITTYLLLILNMYGTRQREYLWDRATNEIKDSVYGLENEVQGIARGSIVGFINFPLPGGFLEPMLNVYYDFEGIEVIPINEVPSDLPDNPKGISIYFGNYNAFLQGKEKVYDISKSFNDIMLKAFYYQHSNDPLEREKYRREYRVEAKELNRTILSLLRK